MPFSWIKQHNLEESRMQTDTDWSICTTDWVKDVWNVLTLAKCCTPELFYGSILLYTETMKQKWESLEEKYKKPLKLPVT